MFTEEFIESVWRKATIKANNAPSEFRQDYAGAWMLRDKYHDRNSEFGWEIEHMIPEKDGGDDSIDNLYPVHWENHLAKGNSYPRWHTVITSEGIKNVSRVRYWEYK